MEVLEWYASLFFYLNTAVFLLGLYKPWLSLWWLDRQNRKMVIKYYGLPAIVLFLVKYFLGFYFTR